MANNNMIFLFWNVQGAGSSQFRRLFKNLVQQHHPDIVAVFEPHISGRLADNFVRSCVFHFSFMIEV